MLPKAIEHGWPTDKGLDGKEYPIHESQASTKDIQTELQAIFDIAEMAEVQLFDEYGKPVYREMYL